MSKKKKSKLFDLCVLFLCMAIAAWWSLFFDLGIVSSFYLYLLLPALYLCLREKKNYLKILFACSVLTILGASLDVIAEDNHAWFVEIASPALSHTLVWGIMPAGLLLWGFCVAFFTLVFYEHFLDDEKHPAISKHCLYALIPAVWAFFSVGAIALYDPRLLHVPYAYLVLMGVAELPLLWVFLKKPKLFHKMLLLGAFFFVLNFVFELTALSLHQWSFPGQYVGWFSIDSLQFPYEELVLWIALSSPIAVFYYEEFFDDGQ